MRLQGHSITKSPRIEADRDDLPPGLCLTRMEPFTAVLDDRTRGLDLAVAAAKAVCAECPLTGIEGPCHRENRDVLGVVAGMTLMERKSLARRKPCGTRAAYDRHIKAKETPCHACRMAMSAVMAEKRAKRKEAAA